MPKFNIYAGLGGGYGGAKFIKTVDCIDVDDAECIAYQYACDDYESYGAFDYEAAVEEEPDQDEEYYSQMYNEDRENWISCYVKPFVEGEDPLDGEESW